MFCLKVKVYAYMCSFRWAAEFAREDKPEGDQRRLMNQFAGVSDPSYNLMIVEDQPES